MLTLFVSISNDIDEVSTCIVCPQCRHHSPKDWFAYEVETKRGKYPKVRKSRVYFRCAICNCSIEIFDQKLKKFIYTELLKENKGYF